MIVRVVDRVERWTSEQDCASVAPTSPLATEGAHRWYENRGYERWGAVVEKGL